MNLYFQFDPQQIVNGLTFVKQIELFFFYVFILQFQFFLKLTGYMTNLLCLVLFRVKISCFCFVKRQKWIWTNQVFYVVQKVKFSSENTFLDLVQIQNLVWTILKQLEPVQKQFDWSKIVLDLQKYKVIVNRILATIPILRQQKDLIGGSRQ